VWVCGHDPATSDWTDARRVDVDPALVDRTLDAAILRVTNVTITSPLRLGTDWRRGDEVVFVGFQPDGSRSSAARALSLFCSIPTNWPVAFDLAPSDEPSLRLDILDRGQQPLGRGVSGAAVLSMACDGFPAIAIEKALEYPHPDELRPPEVKTTAVAWLRQRLDALPEAAEIAWALPRRGFVRMVPDPPDDECLGTPAGTPATRPLTRYADVSLPREAAVGVSIALAVRVTVHPAQPDAAPLDLEVPHGARLVDLTVIARPDGIELAGTNIQHLRVPVATDSDPIHFELVGRREGAASVTVDFYQERRYLASVKADTYVRRAGDAIRATATHTRGHMDLGAAWQAPDLEIRIHESRGASGERRYRFAVTSEKLDLYHFDAGEVALPDKPETWVHQQMEALTALARTLSGASDTVLARLGVDLYDRLCPPELKELYWTHLPRPRRHPDRARREQ
jgi:hypothetical protein